MKGKGSYVPKTNERVMISPPNSDNQEGYCYQEYSVLWIDEQFILYGNEGFWPNLNKLDHVHIKKIESSNSIIKDRPVAPMKQPQKG